MLYLAVLDSDDELSEDAIKEIKNTLFLGDEKASYCFEIASITKAPKDIFENHISSMEMRFEE